MEDGNGVGNLIPPLAQADYMQQHADELACIIRYGLADSIKVNDKIYSEQMLGIPELDDVAITNIANYINYKWPFRENYFSITETRKQLDNCR